MKITTRNIEYKADFFLNVCCDVHKEELYFLARLPGQEFSDTCKNRTKQVERQLERFHKVAIEKGKTTLRIVCEPSGEYDRILMRTAHRMGFHTSYVNTENVVKYRQIETNDTGKTDTKDPKVIASLAAQEKLMRVRHFDKEHLTLRKLSSIAEAEEINVIRLKVQLHKEIVNLFCEYDFKKDFLYTNSGRALVELYGCNPYKIVKTGFKRFEKKMRENVKGINSKTILRLWQSSESSVLHELPDFYIDCLEECLKNLYSDYLRHFERKKKIEQEMIDILNLLRKDDPKIPPPTPTVISEKNMAKLIAETGPLSDFKTWRQVMKYAGLNLRERESGNYKGLTKISKKGRKRLRKVLGNIVLPLSPKHKLYGDFYHSKKDIDKMCGNKAMVALGRNFLRKFFGWYKSGGGEFDRDRWFKCESQYKLIIAA